MLSYVIVIPRLSAEVNSYGIYSVVVSLMIFLQYADLGFLGAGQKYAAESYAKNDRFIDSFSNAYGSNIFDICIGIGLPVLVYSFLYGSISMNIPIERIGWLGNYMLSGNLFIWSLLILFSFTIIVSLVYYKFSLKLNSAFFIFFLYLLFVIALLIF